MLSKEISFNTEYTNNQVTIQVKKQGIIKHITMIDKGLYDRIGYVKSLELALNKAKHYIA